MLKTSDGSWSVGTVLSRGNLQVQSYDLLVESGQLDFPFDIAFSHEVNPHFLKHFLACTSCLRSFFYRHTS